MNEKEIKELKDQLDALEEKIEIEKNLEVLKAQLAEVEAQRETAFILAFYLEKEFNLSSYKKTKELVKIVNEFGREITKVMELSDEIEDSSEESILNEIHNVSEFMMKHLEPKVQETKKKLSKLEKEIK